MNKVLIMGRLGADPELKALQNGSLCKLSVATSEFFSGREGGKQERVEWHRVSVFGKLADACAKHLSKGSRVLVEGKLQTRDWQDKDGVKRYVTEIVASQVTFIDPRRSDEVPY